MKHLIATLCCLCCIHLSSFGQDDKDMLKFPLDKMKVNFAVPDIPAFKGLGVEPSSILRPSTPEALSVIIPQFVTNGNFTLPRSFALEVSPSLLVNSRKSYVPPLDKIIKNRLWNSFRVSLATSRDSVKVQPNATKLGVGLRISLINKGDLKYDRKFIAEKGLLFANMAIGDFDDDDVYMKLKDMSVEEFQKANVPDSVVKKEVAQIRNNTKKIVSTLEGKPFEDRQAIYLEQLQALKEEYKKKNWNAEHLDIALSVVWRSPDNFAQRLAFNKMSLWLTYAIPCKNWGQWLIGINASNASVFDENNQSKNFNQLSLSSRLYAGINQMKAFAEVQYQYNGFNDSNDYFLHLGGEYSIRDGIWLQVYGGYQRGDTFSQVVSSIDLRFSLPEK